MGIHKEENSHWYGIQHALWRWRYLIGELRERISTVKKKHEQLHRIICLMMTVHMNKGTVWRTTKDTNRGQTVKIFQC